jgi:uncharacterized membrane protein YeaQ/YmgE (transglycosylase-associated protein family)
VRHGSAGVIRKSRYLSGGPYPAGKGPWLDKEEHVHILWTLLIGLLAGIVAKFLTPGNNPGGFIITTILGVAGAFLATYLGQMIGWYKAGEGAGFIGAVVGAIILLIPYHLIRKIMS